MAFDWIEEFLSLTEDFRSPKSFRLWTAISVVGAVLERRAGTVTDGASVLYPNQYIVLAGGPASGKTVMVSMARRCLAELSAERGGVYLGPDNPTKASFIKEFNKSTKMAQNGSGLALYSAMYILCMELGVFISKYEKDFVADLTSIYDNLPIYTAPRASTESVVVQAPTLNILAAATPGALGDTIPEIAWTQGFTSRIIFVHGATPKTYRDMFARNRTLDLKPLQNHLREYFNELHGEFIWEDDAQDANRFWFNDEGQKPVPTYGRLRSYNDRRNEHLMKLAMVSAVSAGHGLTVTLEDFRRAQTWLFTTESEMPEIFRSMHQRSDEQLLSDAHHWLYIEWSTPKLEDRLPIKERFLYDWLAKKLPHEHIEGFIKTMERTGRMRKGDLSGGWIPNDESQFFDL